MSYFRNLLIVGVVLVTTTVTSFALKAEYRFEHDNKPQLLNEDK